MEIWVQLLFFLSLFPVFLIMILMPFLTRRNESFGVSIPQEMYNSDIMVSLRKRYVKQTSILAAAIAAVYLAAGSWVGTNEKQWSMLFAFTLVLFMIGSFMIYLANHTKMKRLKAEQKWHQEKTQRVVINTSFRQQTLTYSNAWFIFSFIIFLGTLFITFLFYEEMPQQIPMQYDFSGNVTSWTEKSLKSVLVLPVMQVFIIGVFILTNMIIARAKQQLLAENPEKSLKQNILFRRRWSLFTLITGTAVVLLFFFIQLTFTAIISFSQLSMIIFIFTFGIIIGAFSLSLVTGQGGSRIKVDGETPEEKEINQDEDQYWKLGQIYYNPGDPALFVEKRFGVGWTVNFARPLAWIILLSILLTAVGLPILLMK